MKKPLLALAIISAFCGSAWAADAKFDAFMGRVVGNQTTVTFGGNGTPLVTSSSHLGNAPSVGNMRVVGGAAGPSIEGRATMPVAGTSKTLPVDVKAAIGKRAAAKAILRGAVALTGVGMLIPAAFDIYDYLKNGHELIDPRNEDGQIVADRLTYFDGREYRFGTGNWTTAAAACAEAAASYTGSHYGRFVGFIYSASGVIQYCEIDQVNILDGTSFRRTRVIANRIATQNNRLRVEQQEIEDMIAADSGWPTSSTRALAQALKVPGVGQSIQPESTTITGSLTALGEKVTTTEKVKLIPGTTTVAPPGTAVTQSGTKTTVAQQATKITYNQNTATSNTTNITNITNITNDVTNETTTEEGPEIEKEDAPEIEVCGLPGTPACKIDEAGTPEAKEDTGEKDVKDAIKPLDDFIANPESVLPTFPTINWAFTLPSGCAPIALPAFDPWLQQIDVCAFQPIFHDIMSFVWIMGGIFGAIGTFWRNTFSQG